MVKGRMRYSIFKVFLLVFLIPFCTMCESKDKKTESVKDSIETYYHTKVGNDIRRIFVLNDYGCSNCVRSFSEYVKNNAIDSGSMVLINSRGNHVDLEAFETLKRQNPNIIISHQVNNDSTLFSGLNVIYLDNARIDTVVSLNAMTLQEQLRYIDSRK